MTENKRFVDYFDKDHNYIIQDLVNEDEYQVGFVNCDEDEFLELVNALAETSCDCITDCEMVMKKLKEENEQLKKQIAKDFNQSNCITVQKSKIMDLEKENEQLKSDRLEWITNQQELECLTEENTSLKLENEQLKQQIQEIKTDEKQLSINFMEYKMQLIEVLQQNYNYAYNQRQKNLDKNIVARTYEVLYQTIDNIAESMNVDIERFPKGDVE